MTTTPQTGEGGTATPRTDERAFTERGTPMYDTVPADFARQLERELATVKNDIVGAVRRTEEAERELAEFKENTIGVCAAWKRDYEGEKERGDAWRDDCEKAQRALKDKPSPASGEQINAAGPEICSSAQPECGVEDSRGSGNPTPAAPNTAPQAASSIPSKEPAVAVSIQRYTDVAGGTLSPDANGAWVTWEQCSKELLQKDNRITQLEASRIDITNSPAAAVTKEVYRDTIAGIVGPPKAAVPDDPVALYEQFAFTCLSPIHSEEHMHAIRALAAHYLRQAPEGYALVPLEPSIEQLWILIRGYNFSEDWEVGKLAQREGKNVPPKTECEWAYGWYKRLMLAAAAKQEADRGN